MIGSASTLSDFSDIVGFSALLSDKKISCRTSEFCRIFSKKRIFFGFVYFSRLLESPTPIKKDFQTSKIRRPILLGIFRKSLVLAATV